MRRTLLHPHVEEQSFGRSLKGVEITGNVDAVIVDAQDSVHGYGGQQMFMTIQTGGPSIRITLYAVGIVKQNLLPFPMVLSTSTCPPWASIISFTIAKPSPVPPNRLVPLLSSW